jgi:hypothetical protein
VEACGGWNKQRFKVVAFTNVMVLCSPGTSSIDQFIRVSSDFLHLVPESIHVLNPVSFEAISQRYVCNEKCGYLARYESSFFICDLNLA